MAAVTECISLGTKGKKGGGRGGEGMGGGGGGVLLYTTLTCFVGVLREIFAVTAHVHVQRRKDLSCEVAGRIEGNRGLEYEVQVAHERPFHNIAATTQS